MMSHLHPWHIKIAIEGLPGTGKTTLYNALISRYRHLLISLSPDFVKENSKATDTISQIEKILKSQDKKFLTLNSPIGETLLLISRIALRAENDQVLPPNNSIFLSDKSIDTCFSHALPRLVESGYFDNYDKALDWLQNVLKPFYHYPDLTLYLKPGAPSIFIEKHATNEQEKKYLLQIYRAYNYLYSKRNFEKRVKVIIINSDSTVDSVKKEAFRIVDHYLKIYV